MLPFKIVFSNAYCLPVGEHVFPSNKYRDIHKKLIEEGIAGPEDFVAPKPATDEEVLLVHTPMYVNKLNTGTLSAREELELEVPYSRELVDAFFLQAGGSILAAEHALKEQVCIHDGGGFHHAFPDHGEGFCVIHDVAVAIRKMQRLGLIARAMTLDCDVHQGNGTAAIFHGHMEPFPPPQAWSANLTAPKRPARMVKNASKDVFTISLHQENNYPAWKPASSIDVNLPDGTTDEEYLGWLKQAMNEAFDQFEPELLCYVAGADPYREDQLGGLALTIEGLKQRDKFVFEFVRDRGVPVMVTFAGGYALRMEDTVSIHVNTVAAAKEVFG